MLRPEALLVVEYAGTPRSGKGTIVSHQIEEFQGFAAEETGADYRAITAALHIEGVIESGMGAETIASVVTSTQPAALADMAARRNELVAERGKDFLYTTAVNGLVAYISPMPAVRVAVKDGFKQRVRAVVNRGEAEVLLVDGRNLAPIFDGMPGVHLLLRSYVTCTTEEATNREVARKGVTDEAEKAEIFTAIDRRNQLDANRPEDPVNPDSDAINYWHDPQVTIDNSRHAAELVDEDHAVWEAVYAGKLPADSLLPRYGAGELAVATGRQIFFDTTRYSHMPDSLPRMLDAADQMLREAVSKHRSLQRALRSV